MSRNLALATAALGLVASLALADPADAANVYLSGATAPTGGLWVPDGALPTGGRLWVADHTFGFCPVQPTTATNSSAAFIGSPLAPTGCILAGGQPAMDPATLTAFLPDDSSKSVGIIRVQYRTNTKLFTGSRRTLNGNVANRRCKSGNLAGCRPIAAALDPGGDLYIITQRAGGDIYRIRNALTNNPSGVQLVASTSDGGGAQSLAFVGSDLYIAEATGVTMIQDPSNRVPANIDGEGLCTPNNSCLASDVGLGFLPLAVGSDGTNLFISDLQSLDTVNIYNPDPVNGGFALVPGFFAGVSGFAAAPATVSNGPRLYFAADPSGGAAVGLANWYYQEPVPLP